MTPPFYVVRDDRGDLFLCDAAECVDVTMPVELHDPRLWAAYVSACLAMHKARKAVEDALVAPWKDVIPETLTMKQISEVHQWALENDKKGLHADAVRCESSSPPVGAMRRICAYLNARRGALTRDPCVVVGVRSRKIPDDTDAGSVHTGAEGRSTIDTENDPESQDNP